MIAITPGRGNQKGISLLELLISLILFGIVMITFAMVFPGGYRLSLKNRNESKATKIAEGIIYEVQKLNFLGPGLKEPTVESMQTWTSGYFKDIFEKNIPHPFYLPDEQDLKGIDVKILDKSVGGGGTLARITVTVAWSESTRGGPQTRKVSVTAYRSRNH
jgi:type II secretory pathway pseudopilin PulG